MKSKDLFAALESAVNSFDNHVSFQGVMGVVAMPLFPASLHDLLTGYDDCLPIPVLFRLALSLFHAGSMIASAGLCHCDIKPMNIMIDLAGEFIVIDLGATEDIGKPGKS